MIFVCATVYEHVFVLATNLHKCVFAAFIITVLHSHTSNSMSCASCKCARRRYSTALITSLVVVGCENGLTVVANGFVTRALARAGKFVYVCMS